MKLQFVILSFCCCLLPVSGGNTLIPEPKQLTAAQVSPGTWFAPWHFSAVSESGDKIESLTVEIENTTPAAISEIALFLPRGSFRHELTRFPENWQKVSATKLSIQKNTVTANFATSPSLAAELKNETNLIVGIRLSPKLPATQFTVKLSALKLGNTEFKVNNAPVAITIDPQTPQVKTTVETFELYPGIQATRLLINSNMPAAFEPGVALRYSAMKNYHRWNHFYREPAKKMDNHNYEFIYPHMTRLSGNANARHDKMAGYTMDPQPDHWQSRKDDTGFDLLDADARPSRFATPGGIQFLHTRRAEITFDLKRECETGMVRVYACDMPLNITAATASSADGPWETAAEYSAKMFPQERFGDINTPAMFQLIFPKLHKARYVRLTFDCANSLILTEVEILGRQPGSAVEHIAEFNVYTVSETGATTMTTQKAGEK